jgi:hypothetical protein
LRLLIAKEGESRLFQWLSDALQLSFSKEEKDKYINHIPFFVVAGQAHQ